MRQYVLTVDHDMLSALALGRNLRMIDLRGVNGLTPLHVTNMRSDLNQNCVADVRILCPRKFFKLAVRAQHETTLQPFGGSLAQIFVPPTEYATWTVISAQNGSQAHGTDAISDPLYMMEDS